MSDDELSPREMDRIRRRDRDAEAEARAPMRTGMSKVFKQIQEVQAKEAAQSKPPNKRSRSPGGEPR
jgi:hypothetical protein